MTVQKFDALPGVPRCAVAESPVWDDEGGALHWVDIVGKSVFRYDFATERTAKWQTEDFPTALALASLQGKGVLALASGIAEFDFAEGRARMRCSPDEREGNRLNEGKCDARGRFWVGSMQTNLNRDGSERKMDRNSGALFRVDADFSTSCHSAREFGISNTIAWAPDGRTLYFGDTIRNVIFAYEFDLDDGIVGTRRVLLEGYARGLPDGSAMDADGCLWNARFGGGVVLRIAPDGRVDREIPVPVANPTSCAFAGASRNRLIVTSATFGLSEERIAANPLEGLVLAADIDVAGMPDFRFAGPV